MIDEIINNIQEPLFYDRLSKTFSNKFNNINLSSSSENLQDQKSKIKFIGEFNLGKKLGEGTFGVVRLASHTITHEKVAVKILDKEKILLEADKNRIEREIKILKTLRHPNIVHLYSIIQNESNIYLIMEYIPGKELFDYIVFKHRLQEMEACKFYQQILSGVEYLYKLGIVHRDLKPENMILDSKKNIKIVDFGLSNLYNKNELLETACGSPCYAAPEMINGEKYSGLKVDIWSSGIVLYAMICGYLPFEDDNNDILYQKITEGKFTIPGFVSDSARDLLKKILCIDPKKRFGLKEIKNHPWFNLLNPKINMNEGLLINKIVIPIDEDIVEQIEAIEKEKYEKNIIKNFGKEFIMTKDEIRKLLLNNRHNHITTTYYLLLKKKIRAGLDSVSDLMSKSFKKYINDPSNLLKYYDYNIEKVIKAKEKKIEEEKNNESNSNNNIFKVESVGNKNKLFNSNENVKNNNHNVGYKKSSSIKSKINNKYYKNNNIKNKLNDNNNKKTFTKKNSKKRFDTSLTPDKNNNNNNNYLKTENNNNYLKTENNKNIVNNIHKIKNNNLENNKNNINENLYLTTEINNNHHKNIISEPNYEIDLEKAILHTEISNKKNNNYKNKNVFCIKKINKNIINNYNIKETKNINNININVNNNNNIPFLNFSRNIPGLININNNNNKNNNKRKSLKNSVNNNNNKINNNIKINLNLNGSVTERIREKFSIKMTENSDNENKIKKNNKKINSSKTSSVKNNNNNINNSKNIMKNKIYKKRNSMKETNINNFSFNFNNNNFKTNIEKKIKNKNLLNISHSNNNKNIFNYTISTSVKHESLNNSLLKKISNKNNENKNLKNLLLNNQNLNRLNKFIQNKKNNRFFNTSISFDRSIENSISKSKDKKLLFNKKIENYKKDVSPSTKKRDLKYIKIKSKNKKFGNNNNLINNNNNILIIENYKKNNKLNLSGNNILINSLNNNNNNKFLYKNYIENLNKKKKNKININNSSVNKKNISILNQTIEINNNNNKNLNLSSNLISITESNYNYKNKNNNNNEYKIFDLNCLILLKFSKENFENCLNNLKLVYSFQKNKYNCKKKDLKFQIIVNKVENNFYIVNFKKIEGNVINFRELIQIILNKINF